MTYDYMTYDRATSRSGMADLRARIARIERGEQGITADAPALPVLRLGIAALDTHLPEGGLAEGALHEVTIPAPADTAAATGFCLALLSKLLRARKGMALWCRHGGMLDAGELYPPGLIQRGIPPDRLVVLNLNRDDDVLWAMEEALRSGGPAAVLGEVARADLTATRRLQLAANETDLPALMLRPGWREAGNSAAATRWHITTEQSRPRGLAKELNEPGDPRWRAELFRCRGGAPGAWRMEWRNETGDLALAAPAGDRPGKPRDAGIAG